jgi:hypothetical protein
MKLRLKKGGRIMPDFTPNKNLYKWKVTDTKSETIQQMSNSMDLIDTAFNDLNYYDKTKTNKIYVNGTTGNDTNDGKTLNTPYKTVAKAIDTLMSMSALILNGSWELMLFGTFTQGVTIYDLPRFRYPLKITGDVDVNGNPSTIFDGTNSTVDIGLRIERCPDLRIYVSNLFFKNFKNNFNGYGFLMKSGGYCDVRNCTAQNCDIGFAAVRNVSFFFGKCKGISCLASNFRAQYSSSGTFGDSSNPCTATGGPEGFFISRNAVAHVDYSTADGCTYAGIRADMNSRVGVIQSTLKNCATGVLMQGGAEWINDGAIFSNNTTNMLNNGVGRETRLYSQGTTNEFRIGVDTTQVTHTGTTNNTNIYLGSELGKLPANFFLSKYQRLRFVLRGTFAGNGNKYPSVYSTDTDGNNSVQLAQFTITDTGEFIMEVLCYPKDAANVTITAKIDINGQPSKIYTANRPIDMTKERLFRGNAQLSDATASITYKSFEVFCMG